MRGAPDQCQNYPELSQETSLGGHLQYHVADWPNEIDHPAENKPIASLYVHCGSTIVDVPARDDRGVSMQLFCV